MLDATATAVQMRCRPLLGATGMRASLITPLVLGQRTHNHGTTVRAFAAFSLTYPGRVGPDELLPDQTMDDVDLHDPREESDRDAWIRDQVPPHHG